MNGSGGKRTPRRGAAAPGVRIRVASAGDAPALAKLCGQLGYPADAPAVLRRLRDIEESGAGIVLVAVDEGTAAVGFAHVLPQRSALEEPVAELAALVVADAVRGHGVGRVLLDAIERWSREHGFASVRVHSNVVRTRAHHFYLREGYGEVKRQAVFSKLLR